MPEILAFILCTKEAEKSYYGEQSRSFRPCPPQNKTTTTTTLIQEQSHSQRLMVFFHKIKVNETEM